MMQDDFVMADVNMEGFQLIRGQYFSRQADPVMTLWKSAVGFNAPSYTALNNCEAVQFFVHPTERKIIIKPSPSKEPDSVNWTKDALQAKTNRLECTMFTRRLFGNGIWMRICGIERTESWYDQIAVSCFCSTSRSPKYGMGQRW